MDRPCTSSLPTPSFRVARTIEQIVKASIAKTLIGCEAPFRKKSGSELLPV